MSSVFSFTENRFLIPEVIQTSDMDCGPASLKALAAGFGINANYSYIRDLCHTDIDGTSIDTLEDMAVELGLDAVQIMIPADYLLMDKIETLPALVTTILPNKYNHFISAWKKQGEFIQVMDPGLGRCWKLRHQFLQELFIHKHPASEELAAEWLKSDDIINPLTQRLSSLKFEDSSSLLLIQSAVEDQGWQKIAALDAAARLTDFLVNTRGIKTGNEAFNVFKSFYLNSCDVAPEHIYGIIPEQYWSVRLSEKNDNRLFICGAVLIHVSGLMEQEQADEENGFSEPKTGSIAGGSDEDYSFLKILSGIHDKSLIIIVSAALILSATGITIEAMLLEGILDVVKMPEIRHYRTGIFIGMYVFFIALFLLELPLIAIIILTGRKLEILLRMGLIKKIPMLSDRYFQSRPVSDFIHRTHEMRHLRGFPELVFLCSGMVWEIILTTVCIIFINPAGGFLACLSTALILGISFLSQPFLREHDLRVRTHTGALNRYYLDALLGNTSIKIHNADRSVNTGHETLLVKWVDAGISFYKTRFAYIGTVEILCTGFTILIFINFIENQGKAEFGLLLLYWLLKLPILSLNLADILQQFPIQQNRMLRLLEILDSSEEISLEKKGKNKSAESKKASPASHKKGMNINIENVSIKIGGHKVLKDISIKVEPGEHIAVVGPSGAGKSSLAGLLLGWYCPPHSGTVKVDENILSLENLNYIRSQTAWADPGIQIWNRSIKKNILYGNINSSDSTLEKAVKQADLDEIIKKLPNGINTVLGEGGGLLSAGEGQLLRLGRAFMRPDARLVILDEAFTGLDKKTKDKLLKRVREFWKHSTMIFISHDISHALTFNRVLVVEKGKIIEDNAPELLFKDETSSFSCLLKSEKKAVDVFHESEKWRFWNMDKGCLSETKRFS